MVRILKSDPPATNPRIEAVLPNAALPGGEIEVHGANLGASQGASGLQRPHSAIGGAVAPVLLTRNTRLVIRVPDAASTSPKLEVFRNGSRSNQFEVHVA